MYKEITEKLGKAGKLYNAVRNIFLEEKEVVHYNIGHE